MFRCFGRLFSLTYFVLHTKLTFVTHCMEKQNWKDFSDRATRCWVPEMQQTKIKTIQGNAFDTARRSRETIVFPTLDKRLLTKNMSLPRASRVSWLNAMDSQLGCNLFQGFTLSLTHTSVMCVLHHEFYSVSWMSTCKLNYSRSWGNGN